MSAPPQEINLAFRDLRKRLGYSQQAFASKLGLAIRTVTHYERDRTPPPELVNQLAEMSQDNGFEDLRRRFQAHLISVVGAVGISISEAYHLTEYALEYLHEHHRTCLAENGYDPDKLGTLDIGMNAVYQAHVRLIDYFRDPSGEPKIPPPPVTLRIDVLDEEGDPYLEDFYADHRRPDEIYEKLLAEYERRLEYYVKATGQSADSYPIKPPPPPSSGPLK